MRLDKFVADAAQLTRSAARGLIAKGRVTVNGQVCRKADCALKEGDSVCADGKPLACEEYVYIMLNKPAGVVSASTDGRDKTVVDLVGGAFPRRQLFPAGRLDKTSTGFVLLTDDGAFAHDILAPKRHVPKTYRVVLDTPVTDEMVKAFAATVVLRQGVYHQIKRMFGVLDAGVNQLHRTAIGGLALDEGLAPGAWRLITPEEKALIQAGGEG